MSNVIKISVCIPTYNQSKYLEIAILSAINQTVKPFEIIVSNDASTDDTSEVLEKLIHNIPELKIINQKQNLGIAKNTDYCLRQATGDFIVRLDSDDYLLPSYLEKLSNALLQWPNAAYAHGNVQEVDQFGNNTRLRLLNRKAGYIDCNTSLIQSKYGYKVAANIIMFRRTALESVHFISNRPDYVEDYHLSVTLAAAGYGNVFVSEILSCYRIWIDSGKVRQKRKLLEIDGLIRVFEDVLIPSYRINRLNLKKLYHEKNIIARRQADCLSWDVYTIDEKNELLKSLIKLSNSKLSIIWYKVCLSEMNKYYILPKIRLLARDYIKRLIR